MYILIIITIIDTKNDSEIVGYKNKKILDPKRQISKILNLLTLNTKLAVNKFQINFECC